MSGDIKLRRSYDLSVHINIGLFILLCLSILGNIASGFGIAAMMPLKTTDFLVSEVVKSDAGELFIEIKKMDQLTKTEKAGLVKTVLKQYVVDRQSIHGYYDQERFDRVFRMTDKPVRDLLLEERKQFAQYNNTYRRHVDIISSRKLEGTDMYEIDWDVTSIYNGQERVQKYRSILTYSVPLSTSESFRKILIDAKLWETNPLGIVVHNFEYRERK